MSKLRRAKILNLSVNWKNILKDEFEKEYFKKLMNFLENEYAEKKIFPPKELIFNVFNHLEYKDIKVVILGQDPYHGEGQGNGIAFSVNEGIKIPPSLRNMYKELCLEYSEDINKFYEPKTGNLTSWVEQGVFMLNTALTVREAEANSHSKKGWEVFTDAVLKKINEKTEPVVFILWGNNAKLKKALITNPKHLILEGVHPSPLSASRGFFGCNHFKKTNDFLKDNGLEVINWRI